MNIYLRTKPLHLFFVMGWMTTVFALPVLLLSMANPEMESAARPQDTEAVQDDSHENSALNQKPRSNHTMKKDSVHSGFIPHSESEPASGKYRCDSVI